MNEAVNKLLTELDQHDDAPAISNYIAIENAGTKKTDKVARSMSDIVDEINQRTGDWPRRIDAMLFVDDPEHGLGYFDRRTTSGLFGWLRRHHKVEWQEGGNYVSQSELFAELERSATRYNGVEVLPHEPPIAGIYYRCTVPEPGDGSHLQQLLNRFRPETTIDRDLILAAILTVFWGGPAGCRPLFVVTSDDGRGAGKSKLVEVISRLCFGHFSVSAGEDIGTLKKRMLTPTAREKRIAFMDNIKSFRFSWAELEALVTESVISGNQNYVGEGQRPNYLTWFVTLNGVSLATDMAQRAVVIKVVKGDNSGDWWEATCKFIDDHREQIVGDVIGFLRSPTNQPANFQFSRWATWEQQVLCRLPDPAEAQRLILERQGESDCEVDEAELIEQFFADQLDGHGYRSGYDQVRIPNGHAAAWYCRATGERPKVAAACRRLQQMAKEKQLKRIEKDPSRKHGRGFIWTGADADHQNEPIMNDLRQQVADPWDS